MLVGALHRHGFLWCTPMPRNVLVVGCVLNLFLDPWFLYGGLGLPALGMAGIALATVLITVGGTAWVARATGRPLVRDPAMETTLRAHFGERATDRIAAFGGTEMSVVGQCRVRTENNCVPRDIVQIGGRLLFGYNVFIGGGAASTAEQAMAREYATSIAFDELPSLLEKLLAAYLTHRTGPAESFFEFCCRHEIAALRALAEKMPLRALAA